MKLKAKPLVSMVCALAMCAAMLPAQVLADTPDESAPASVECDISKSKTATPLTIDSTSKVTLSLPSAEEQLVSDVVFVLDKSTSPDMEDEMIAMLSDLSEQVETTGAKVNVGVVIFNKQANTCLELTELNADNMDEIETAIRTEAQSGTNTHAGMLVGKEMLDNDTAVDADRKYLVFVSDGLTYIFDKEMNAINSIQATNGENGVMHGNDCWGIRHYLEGGDKYIPEDWSVYLQDVADHLSDVQQYVQPYNGMDDTNYIPKGNTELPTTVDVALYKTSQVFEEAVDAGYHCYSIKANSEAASNYPWGQSYMEYLQTVSGNDDVTFEDIQNDIYYLVDAGSKVIDVIGSGENYDFQFINDPAQITLTVNGVSQKLTRISDTSYGFGDPNGSKDGQTYPYILTYYPDGSPEVAGEHFVWEINVPVTNFNPVQLTYGVKLSSTEVEVGDYLADTNTSATLKYISTDGQTGEELFPVPNVNYHIALLQPADMTIYMGGEHGYSGVADETGEIQSNNSLPEPGYYITLPSEINTVLEEAGLVTEGIPANLSDLITIRTVGETSYTWTLVPYGNTFSAANNKYIYAITPANDETPSFRLNFTDENGTTYDSDNFDPADIHSLSQHYKMNVYAGLVDLRQVIIQIDIPVGEEKTETYYCTMTTAPGNLNIRYVTGDQDSVVTSSFTSVEEASKEDNPNKTALDKAYVIRDKDTKFFINDSDVDVTETEGFADVSLLFDDIVTDGNTEGASDYYSMLTDKAVDEAAEGMQDVKYEAKYLDLVDANNGNVWLTPSEKVTIYWPYPDGTDANTTFKLVHFKDLDREMNLEDVAAEIESAEIETLTVTTDAYGISFQTDSFSPYVLLWDNSQSTTVVGTPTPDEHPDIAEAIANGTWGQPTPTPAPAVIPQTSDDMPITLLIGAAGIAAAGIVVLVILRKRKRNQ